MKLKKATAVSEELLQSFLQDHGDLSTLSLKSSTSYVLKEADEIISLFQIEFMNDKEVWLKTLLITEAHALRLPQVFQAIMSFVYDHTAATIYVHSTKPVTDLLLRSSAFTLQGRSDYLPFQKNHRGNWWYYSFRIEEKDKQASL